MRKVQRLCVLVLGLALGTMAACSDRPDEERTLPASRPDIEEGLAPPTEARMSTKLERTILGIDVLGMEIRFGPPTSGHLDALSQDHRGEDEFPEALTDSVAGIAMVSGNALVRIDLLRDVPLDRYLEEVRNNLRTAAESGVLPRSELETISGRMRPWFSFLEERGLQEGDRLAYRIRGDTVRTVYVGGEGRLLLDQTDPNAADQRRAVLGGYLAEGVELREDLIRSLFSEDDG